MQISLFLLSNLSCKSPLVIKFKLSFNSNEVFWPGSVTEGLISSDTCEYSSSYAPWSDHIAAFTLIVKEIWHIVWTPCSSRYKPGTQHTVIKVPLWTHRVEAREEADGRGRVQREGKELLDGQSGLDSGQRGAYQSGHQAILTCVTCRRHRTRWGAQQKDELQDNVQQENIQTCLSAACVSKNSGHAISTYFYRPVFDLYLTLWRTD